MWYPTFGLKVPPNGCIWTRITLRTLIEDPRSAASILLDSGIKQGLVSCALSLEEHDRVIVSSVPTKCNGSSNMYLHTRDEANNQLRKDIRMTSISADGFDPSRKLCRSYCCLQRFKVKDAALLRDVTQIRGRMIGGRRSISINTMIRTLLDVPGLNCSTRLPATDTNHSVSGDCRTMTSWKRDNEWM